MTTNGFDCSNEIRLSDGFDSCLFLNGHFLRKTLLVLTISIIICSIILLVLIIVSNRIARKLSEENRIATNVKRIWRSNNGDIYDFVHRVFLCFRSWSKIDFTLDWKMLIWNASKNDQSLYIGHQSASQQVASNKLTNNRKDFLRIGIKIVPFFPDFYLRMGGGTGDGHGAGGKTAAYPDRFPNSCQFRVTGKNRSNRKTMETIPISIRIQIGEATKSMEFLSSKLIDRNCRIAVWEILGYEIMLGYTIRKLVPIQLGDWHVDQLSLVFVMR